MWEREHSPDLVRVQSPDITRPRCRPTPGPFIFVGRYAGNHSESHGQRYAAFSIVEVGLGPARPCVAHGVAAALCVRRSANYLRAHNNHETQDTRPDPATKVGAACFAC